MDAVFIPGGESVVVGVFGSGARSTPDSGVAGGMRWGSLALARGGAGEASGAGFTRVLALMLESAGRAGSPLQWVRLRRDLVAVRDGVAVGIGQEWVGGVGEDFHAVGESSSSLSRSRDAVP